MAAFVALLSLNLGLAARQAGQPGQGQPGQRGGGRGGQRGANLPPAGPTPRLTNGKPDFSGHWNNPYTPNMAGAGGATALDPSTRMPFDWPHEGEPLPDGKGQPKPFDLPYQAW